MVAKQCAQKPRFYRLHRHPGGTPLPGFCDAWSPKNAPHASQDSGPSLQTIATE